jgi:hypothetical protein
MSVLYLDKFEIKRMFWQGSKLNYENIFWKSLNPKNLKKFITII